MKKQTNKSQILLFLVHIIGLFLNNRFPANYYFYLQINFAF